MQALNKYNLINISEQYKDLIYRWRNSNHVRHNMYSDHLISMEEHNCWFNCLERADIVARLFVYDEQPIGFVNFVNIDLEQGECSWGFYIGETDAPKGSGQIMAFLSLNLIFDRLNLSKVNSEILDFNVRSYVLHQKMGFSDEGRLSEQISKNGRYVDVILMGLIKDAWLSRREKLLKEWGG